MSDVGGIGYSNKTYKAKMRRVHFAGTTAILVGHPLCYNHDYGTLAATAEYGRQIEVEVPTALNNRWFAGVAAEAKTGPCFIDIILPGSLALVFTDVACVLDTTFLTFKTADSEFGYAGIGFDGRGSAIAKQTLDRSGTAGTVLAYLQDGPESGGVQLMLAVDNAVSTPVGAPGAAQYWAAAATLTNGDSSETVVDGVRQGDRHAINAGATMTTNDVDVTVSKHETSDPEHYFLKAAQDYAYMAWFGDQWNNLALTAPTTT